MVGIVFSGRPDTNIPSGSARTRTLSGGHVRGNSLLLKVCVGRVWTVHAGPNVDRRHPSAWCARPRSMCGYPRSTSDPSEATNRSSRAVVLDAVGLAGELGSHPQPLGNHTGVEKIPVGRVVTGVDLPHLGTRLGAEFAESWLHRVRTFSRPRRIVRIRFHHGPGGPARIERGVARCVCPAARSFPSGVCSSSRRSPNVTCGTTTPFRVTFDRAALSMG